MSTGSRAARLPSGAAPSRSESKELTRQALLRAALELLGRHSFDRISLREVTRAAGVSPTAFYRHFDDMEELGMVLVDEALGELRALARDLRLLAEASAVHTADAIAAVVRYIDDHALYVRFVTRERHGGVRTLRRAIRRELDLFTEELATELGRAPIVGEWGLDDRRALASVLFETNVHLAAELVDARPEQRAALIGRAERQLRFVLRAVTAAPPPPA